jgi:hypothetical protein
MGTQEMEIDCDDDEDDKEETAAVKAPKAGKGKEKDEAKVAAVKKVIRGGKIVEEVADDDDAQ